MITLQPAEAAHAAAVLRMREDAAHWQRAEGIRQWAPGEVSLPEIQAQVAAGEWFVHIRESIVAASVRLLWSDPIVWGSDRGDAAYVHGLMVGRLHAGRGIGLEVLEWAGTTARDAGRRFLRLDCVETNERLRHYYCAAGFTEVGRRQFANGWRPVVLMERSLV